MQEPGNGHKKALHFHHPPSRVVSLVPSITESMFDLGFGSAVVGVTDYCIHPAASLEGLPRVGGPKNPNVEGILDLSSDLVLANWEENQRQTVDTLESYGVPVWVTFPKTVNEAIDILWTLVGLFKSREAAVRLQTLEVTLEWATAAASERTPLRYFCPIWVGELDSKDLWWMTFNRDTYAHDLLRLLGGENVFANRQRRYPLKADLGLVDAEDAGERDTRYPRLAFTEVSQAQPQVILLPDEPYPFTEEHRGFLCTHLADSEVVKNDRIHLVDGTLNHLAWNAPGVCFTRTPESVGLAWVGYILRYRKCLTNEFGRVRISII